MCRYSCLRNCSTYIRHRAGACGGTVCVYGLCSSLATPSSILSLQAPSFSLHVPILRSSELQAPGLGAGAGSSSLEAGVWSLQPHLREGQGGSSRAAAWLPPPLGELPAPKLAYLASSWRSWAPSWHQDATTSPKISKKNHLGANIFQPSSQNPPKTASRTLQRRPQTPKKPQKVIKGCSFLHFQPFFQRSRTK